MAENDGRLKRLEEFRREHFEERRELLRRREDRRRQRITWIVALIGPLIALATIAWGGVVAVLRAMHIVGPKI